MAVIGRCQSVIINNTTYCYGEVIPYIKWHLDDDTENEMINAKITAVDGVDANSVQLESDGVVVSVCLEDIID